MKTTNETVCIAIDHLYDDSMGDYAVFYLWDGEKVYTEGGMYSGVRSDAYEVNATREQIAAASAAYIESAPETYNYNKYCYGRRGCNTFIGCIVKLHRSRKAPNNTDLTVVDFHEAYYCNRYNQHVPEKLTVTDGVSTWAVSSNCIKTVVKGVKEKPFWYLDK